MPNDSLETKVQSEVRKTFSSIPDNIYKHATFLMTVGGLVFTGVNAYYGLDVRIRENRAAIVQLQADNARVASEVKALTEKLDTVNNNVIRVQTIAEDIKLSLPRRNSN